VPCRLAPKLALAGVVLLAPGGPLAAATDPVSIALLPVQNRAGDSSAAARLETILRSELELRARLIAGDAVRDALRRLRLRNADRGTPALLQRLGEELAADWLITVTLHDADRELVPRLSVSLRVYASASGELSLARFAAASGLDRRKLLGLGQIAELERLVPIAVERLLRALPESVAESGGAASGGASQALATVAVVPFDGSTPVQATQHAETVTEAAYARLMEDGVPLVSPNSAHEILRRQQGGRWGGVTAEARAALHASSGADAILTGSVETYEVGGAEQEPEPRVAVALRLLDAASGRILWTGSLERSGWDKGGLFRTGRVYSRGALTEQILRSLVRRLRDADVLTTTRPRQPRPRS